MLRVGAQIRRTSSYLAAEKRSRRHRVPPNSMTVRQAPIGPNPLATVEIRNSVATDYRGAILFRSVACERDWVVPLEQMLRCDPIAGSDDAPRPPMRWANRITQPSGPWPDRSREAAR
jgi:hypothetical protein